MKEVIHEGHEGHEEDRISLSYFFAPFADKMVWTLFLIIFRGLRYPTEGSVADLLPTYGIGSGIADL
ncbi:MAG: hypothetical protein BECKG1743F_GA0114225_103085 [Candidatus Kentron sp. G]|nr:MAG: hypothetical protein BECKG1743F_GA0114225_103085 [Candidatus Kentron sp. G]VFN01714.1 MAG: hypothetical protein BECKG1743E_GA0114224_104374 [Candidatus Kentron sp. G]